MVDDWEFSEAQFTEFVGTTFTLLAASMGASAEYDSQLQVGASSMIVSWPGRGCDPAVQHLTSRSSLKHNDLDSKGRKISCTRAVMCRVAPPLPTYQVFEHTLYDPTASNVAVFTSSLHC